VARSPDPDEPVPSRLARRLGTADAVVIGLGAMLGTGIFAAVGPAVRAAGPGLLPALLLAAAVAWCNAISSARLAARHPASGGAYVWGRERLGPFAGHLAGWAFVAGKLASATAAALTLGRYAAPGQARLLAIAAVAVLVAVNCAGIRKTAGVTRLLVAGVLLGLAAGIAAALLGGAARAERLDDLFDVAAPGGLLEAAAILFFAFAGYARIATLGEEVVDPARTIPRAIPLALGVALAVYAAVAAAALAALGPEALARAPAPLAAAAGSGRFDVLVPLVRAGAVVATLGVLLSLLAGVSRTVFAMAADRHLPGALAAVHPGRKVPQRAELTVGAVVAGAVLAADVTGAITFSAFTVLVYYAVANAAALTLSRSWRSRAVPGAGLAGCAVLAGSLPAAAIGTGLAALAAGVGAYAVTRRRARPPARSRPPRPGPPRPGPPRPGPPRPA
jgi:APA family basic amino acid/polyamine antiporter